MIETRELAIADPPALGREIRRAIVDRHCGNRSAAAREIGLHRVHLYKLERGEIGRIEESTFDALCGLVGPKRARFVRRAVVVPGAEKLLRQHGRWLLRELRPLLSAHAPTYAAGMKLIDDIERGLRTRPGAANRWRKAVDRIIDRKTKRATPDGWYRLLLAVWRIRQPMMGDPSGIERTGQELSPDERADFLEAGVVRECILLDRPLALERAQEIAAERDRSAKRWRLDVEEIRAKSRAELERIGVAEWNRRLESRKRPTRP